MAKVNPLLAAMALLKEAGSDAKLDDQQVWVANGEGYDYRNNDAVAVFANLPKHFKPGICKCCGKTFAVNKRSVGFCSDPCRREDWRKTTGLEWGAVSTHDVWDNDPPMIITPEQLKNLKAIVDWFTQNQTSLESAVVQTTEGETQEVQEHDYRWHETEVFPPGIQNQVPSNILHQINLEALAEESQEEDHDSRTSPHDEPDLLNPPQNEKEVDALFGF